MDGEWLRSYIAVGTTHNAAAGQMHDFVVGGVPLLRAAVGVADGLNVAGADSVLVQVGNGAKRM